jgi:hypothetical protein
MKNALLIAIIPVALQLSTTTAPPVRKLPKTETNSFATSFSVLRVHETGHGVNLQWKMSSSSGIRGFIIESTYEDATDPYSVWQMRGMTAQSSGMNMFSDNNLLPGILNYRITAIDNGNSPVAVSDMLTVTVP